MNRKTSYVKCCPFWNRSVRTTNFSNECMLKYFSGLQICFCRYTNCCHHLWCSYPSIHYDFFSSIVVWLDKELHCRFCHIVSHIHDTQVRPKTGCRFCHQHLSMSWACVQSTAIKQNRKIILVWNLQYQAVFLFETFIFPYSLLHLISFSWR